VTLPAPGTHSVGVQSPGQGRYILSRLVILWPPILPSTGKLHVMDVAIIGAGVGGLSAAITLAAAGAQVTVFEQLNRAGGKLGQWSSEGFTFDTGPHVLTMPWTFEELLLNAGEPGQAGIEWLRANLIRLDTICRYHFPGGDSLDAHADLEAASAALAQLAPGDVKGFHRFLRYAEKVTEATTEPFLKQDFASQIHGMPSGEQWRQLGGFLSLRPWRSLREVVHKHFLDPRVRQIFELYALYSGSHPARCPGIYATIADIQWRQGTYYVSGGLYRVAELLRSIAEDLGVRFLFDSPVGQVIVKQKAARGISLVNGCRYFADAVVCNADCLAAIPKLLPEKFRPSLSDDRIAKIEPSTSAFLLLLGVKGEYPQLAHHNSFLSENGDAEYDSIFTDQRPALDPTIGVACQTATDSSRAPAGCSNLFVMTNPPALSKNFDWNAESDQYRNHVLMKLERMGLEDLRERIIVEQIWTPEDLKQRYDAFRGAIYGSSGNGWRNAFLRPPNISKDVDGLYFVGGSTHPGGGIPLCILSGMNVGKMIAGRKLC